MLAPIGVAAVSTESVASFSTFSIHQNGTHGKSISQLNDKKHWFLRIKYRELFDIYKIFMVLNKLLLHIQERTAEIFVCCTTIDSQESQLLFADVLSTSSDERKTSVCSI